MSERLRVALAVPHGLSWLERALQSIAEVARAEGGWAFTRMPEKYSTSIQWLKHWSGDGAFATVIDHKDMQVASSLKFPVINLAGYLEDNTMSTVCVDHEAIGRLGATHLLGKKFRRFGFYGASRYWYSRLRLKGFREAVEQAGGTCAAHDADSGHDSSGYRDEQLQLNYWLSTLQQPVGIMASTDVRASMVLEACRTLRLRVPEDVAILGVDNDPVITELEDPPLTSIARNGRQVGRQAAELLLQLIRQPSMGRQQIFVPPEGIFERGSTRTVAVDDPVVAEIVRYVREHVAERFGVERLLSLFSLSRRALEYRFRSELHTSPYDFINAQRVEAAKTMLKENRSAKLAAVAAACGFADERRLRLVFQRTAGVTPAAFRKEQRFEVLRKLEAQVHVRDSVEA